MEIEFDPDKSAKNERERGLPFEFTAELEWEKASSFLDDRFAYGEARITAWVPFEGRLYVVCFTQRREVYRIISFRKANEREEKAYAQATADQ